MARERHLQYRGWRWSVERCLIAVPVSGMAGAVFGLLNGWAAGVTSNDSGAGAFAFLIGGFVGLILSPLLMLVTVSRGALEGIGVVTIVTSTVSIVSGAWGVILIAPVAAYALSCIGWRIFKGSDARVHRAGFCTKCGYNLVGLVAAVCPECGVSRSSVLERGDLGNMQARHE